MERDLDVSGSFEDSEKFSYQADGLGSVTELTDLNGVVTRAYVYDSFGQIVSETGALENPYTYTGREFDQETGLYFYRARYYDAATGRFLAEDSVGFSGGDLNLFTYVGKRGPSDRTSTRSCHWGGRSTEIDRRGPGGILAQ